MLEVFYNNIAQIIGLVLFLVFLFILGREFFLWYFKINKNIENQNRIISLLEKSVGNKENYNENSYSYFDRQVLKEQTDASKPPFEKMLCAQCNKPIQGTMPLVISEHGETKYFCSEDCRLNNLKINS